MVGDERWEMYVELWVSLGAFSEDILVFCGLVFGFFACGFLGVAAAD